MKTIAVLLAVFMILFSVTPAMAGNEEPLAFSVASTRACDKKPPCEKPDPDPPDDNPALGGGGCQFSGEFGADCEQVPGKLDRCDKVMIIWSIISGGAGAPFLMVGGLLKVGFDNKPEPVGVNDPGLK